MNLKRDGFQKLIERLTRHPAFGEQIHHELTQLTGTDKAEQWADLFIAFCMLIDENPAELHKDLWKKHLVDPNVPLAQRAVALILATEPCAHGVSGLHPVVAYSWEETFMDLVPWKQVDAKLYELTYQLICLQWNDRQPTLTPQESYGTEEKCIKSEYLTISSCLLWLYEQTVALAPMQLPSRAAVLFKRLPLNWGSISASVTMDSIGDMLLAAHKHGHVDLFLSCYQRTISDYYQFYQHATRKEERRYAVAVLAFMWRALPEQLVRCSKEQPEILNEENFWWYVLKILSKPRQMPDFYDGLPSKSVLELVSVAHDALIDVQDGVTWDVVMGSYSGGSDEICDRGLFILLPQAILWALHYLERDPTAGLDDFLVVSSDEAKKGLELLGYWRSDTKHGPYWADLPNPELRFLAQLLRQNLGT